MKGNSFKTLFVLFLLVPLTLSSCLKNKEEDLRQQEKDNLKKYLEKNNITVSPTSSGLYIVKETEGTGASPIGGDYVDFDYTLIRVDGEEVVMTTDSVVAKDNDLYSDALIYGPERLVIGTNIQGLDEGLMAMKEGGETTLIMPSDIAWGRNPYSPVGSYNAVIFKVRLHRILPDPAFYEATLINQYLTSNEIDVDSTAAGVYVIETTPGSTDTTEVADIDRLMTMNIKGSLMDGRVFFPERSVRTVISTNKTPLFTNGLIEGIKNMSLGESATIIVPYNHGYGTSGNLQTAMGIQKLRYHRYAALKYEVDLVEINN